MPRLAVALLFAAWGLILGTGCGFVLILADHATVPEHDVSYKPFEPLKALRFSASWAGPLMAWCVLAISLVHLGRPRREMLERCVAGSAFALAAALAIGGVSGWLASTYLLSLTGVVVCAFAYGAGAAFDSMGARALRLSFVDWGVALGAAVAGLWLLWRWGR